MSNDGGYDAEGIGAVVEALIALPDTNNVTVVAPAENQVRGRGSTTPGELTATDEETLSGYPVTAVQGFPADAVNYGGSPTSSRSRRTSSSPGLNEGQNMGPSSRRLSGTVGRPRRRRPGHPALATSQGSTPALRLQDGRRLRPRLARGEPRRHPSPV